MTAREKAIAVIQSLGADVSMDEVIDRLYFVRKVEIGLAQADADDVQDHDAFFDEIERDDEN